jgi:hypothetical protein
VQGSDHEDSRLCIHTQSTHIEKTVRRDTSRAAKNDESVSRCKTWTKNIKILVSPVVDCDILCVIRV